MNVEEVLRHVGTKTWQEVIGKYALRSNYTLALDIGTGSGLSAYSIAINGSGSIISLDPDSKGTALSWAKRHGYEDRVTFINQTSHEYFANSSDEFELIVIDGSHEYADVVQDLNNSWAHLKAGGYLVCDDYGHPRFVDDVKRAIDEFVAANSLSLVVDNAKAIIQKNV